MGNNFVTGRNIEASGTSLMGNVIATRELLESVFGYPNFEEDGYDKVTTEWVIRFDDGLIATIYDWKRYEQGAPGVNEVYAWHVGGSVADAARRVRGLVFAAMVDHDDTVASVSELPACDFCEATDGVEQEAVKTHDGNKVWAFVCGECLADHASPRVMMHGLGLGRVSA